jgi:hypothetical protein
LELIGLQRGIVERITQSIKRPQQGSACGRSQCGWPSEQWEHWEIASLPLT